MPDDKIKRDEWIPLMRKQRRERSEARGVTEEKRQASMPLRTKEERDARLIRINRWYLQGVPIQTIAKREGLSKQQTSRDLLYLRGLWRAATVIDIDEHKSKELARLDVLEAEAWTAWQSSRSDRRQITKSTKDVPVSIGDGDISINKQIENKYQRSKRDGNSKFLEVVLQCIERRCKILGLDAPERTEMALAMTASQQHQVEFVDRVLGNPAAVRAAHEILAIAAPDGESVLNTGRPGRSAERESMDTSDALTDAVDAALRSGSGSDTWINRGDAAETREE